jgi:hypothetical protein
MLETPKVLLWYVDAHCCLGPCLFGVGPIVPV